MANDQLLDWLLSGIPRLGSENVVVRSVAGIVFALALLTVASLFLSLISRWDVNISNDSLNDAFMAIGSFSLFLMALSGAILTGGRSQRLQRMLALLAVWLLVPSSAIFGFVKGGLSGLTVRPSPAVNTLLLDSCRIAAYKTTTMPTYVFVREEIDLLPGVYISRYLCEHEDSNATFSQAGPHRVTVQFSPSERYGKGRYINAADEPWRGPQ